MTINDYLLYKKGVINFIRKRNERIKNYVINIQQPQ